MQAISHGARNCRGDGRDAAALPFRRSPPALARGEADLAIIGVSPILDAPGVELVGWLPPDLQSYVVFTASISAEARELGAARTFLNVLTSPAAVALFKAHGFEPAPR